MRKVAMDHIKPGSLLAKTIQLDSVPLLSKGAILTANYIEKLKQIGYPSAYICDGFTDDISIENLVSEDTKIKTVKYLKKLFFNHDLDNRQFDFSPLRNLIIDLINEINTKRKSGLSINDTYVLNDYLFNHSLNVSIISIFIGLCLNWDNKKIIELGLGALLHDIGKAKVPAEILNKPGKLTAEEYEIVKMHTIHGYEMLSLYSDIDVHLPLIALHHHERCDGSGYPKGLQNQVISQFAKVVAIADVYDAMGSDRCFAKSKPAHEIYQYFAGNSGKLFDISIVNKFASNIALYPNGTLIMLSDGRSGFVIRQNPSNFARPLVRLIWDCDGVEMPEPIEIDLSTVPDLEVFQIISGGLQGIINEEKFDKIS